MTIEEAADFCEHCGKLVRPVVGRHFYGKLEHYCRCVPPGIVEIVVYDNGAEGPWLTDVAECLACTYKWIVVAPCNRTNIPCPSCGSEMTEPV